MCVSFLQINLLPNGNNYKGLLLGPSNSKAQDSSCGLFGDAIDLMWERHLNAFKFSSLHLDPNNLLKDANEEEK